MAQLPIRKLTLWKQGIGYFERRGTTQERTISLVVPRSATNDVLKSLNIIVHQGGQVLSVDYETPEDKANVLNNLAVKVAERSSLVDLLVSLRGTRVSLTLADDQTVSGRVIGVEASLEQAPMVLLQTEANSDQLQILPVAQVQRILLLDSRAANDVSFFLDVSQVEHTRTTLTIRVDEGEHDLEIGYLAPSPVWRVSYRLFRTSPTEAMLTAWGIFENSLDEDLADVALTLISGRPISFIYDLYESSIPRRPEVGDNDEVMQQLSNDPRVMEAIGSISHDVRSPLSTVTGYIELLKEDGNLTQNQLVSLESMHRSVTRVSDMLNDMLSLVRMRDSSRHEERSSIASAYRSGPLGDLKVSGRYFVPLLMSHADAALMTYRVDTPVSVRRGQSAMVPILNTSVQVSDLIIYNGDKMPNHPLKVWALQNTSGYALEQGPVTLIDSGYAGEGILRFTGAGDSLQIPYALEFGVVVQESYEPGQSALFSLRFDADKKQAIVQRAQINTQTYTLSNRLQTTLTVLIERRNPNRGDYYQMPEPASSEANHTRWAVLLNPGEEVAFPVTVRVVNDANEDPLKWSDAFVDDLREANLLAADANTLLENLLASKQQVTQANETIKTLKGEQERNQALQEQLRKNLAALGDSSREASLRDQVLTDLEQSENRRREIETRLRTLEAQIEVDTAQQREIIDQLYGE